MFSLNGIEPTIGYLIWIALSCIAAHHVSKSYGFWAGVAAAWMSFSALRLFAAPASPYAGEEDTWNAILSLSAASALIGIILAFFCARLFQLRSWIIFWNYAALLNAAMILIGLFLGQPCGLLGNASMSGCFNAVLFPLFFDKKGRIPWCSALIIPLSIIATQKNQPIALLFLTLGITLIRKKHWKELGLAIVASGLVGALFVGHLFGNSEGRTTVWAMAYDFFSAHANPFLGVGLGTFYYIGPWMTYKPLGQAFMWLHSDWLQVLFETGSIGFALTGVLFLDAVVKAYRHPMLFTSLLAYGGWGIANFPVHNPLSALLGTFLLTWAIEIVPKETRRFHSNCRD